MRTRREQMQAYRFVIRRIVAAVLSGEPETLDRPMRRLGLSMFVSAMIAVVVFAGFGVYGLLANPGGPLDNGTIVIERGTGTTYVYLDQRLHPVLNLASARLILGEPADARTVSPRSLVDTPRGPTLGILDAPEALPEPRHLIGLPWRVCSVPPTREQIEPTTTVVIDRGLSGVEPLTGDQALYVTTGEDERYLLWNDHRLRVPDPSAQTALGLHTVVPVGQPLINTITAGPDLAPPPLADAGEETDFAFHGEPARIGDVFLAGDLYYLLTSNGLVGIGEVTWRLLEGDSNGTQITTGAAGAALHEVDLEAAGFPTALPRLHPAANGSPTVCAAYLGEAATGPLGTRIEVFESTPEELSTGADALEMVQTERDPVPVADRVVIAGGRGALVRAIPHAGAPDAGATLYLVTDQGLKYPLSQTEVDARQALGYGEVDPVPIPAELVAMLPTGPELSYAAAMRPAVLPSE